MTLVKAHKLVELMINYKRAARAGLTDPKKPWNEGDDIVKSAASMMVEGIDNDIKWLITIKNQLPPQIKCSHPKKMQDITKNGQKYCMNCNADLE